jgi:hypothetical protein
MAAVAPIAAPLMLASSAVSAYGQIRAGQAQREMYDEQAAQARMRGRSEAIAYKQQGADVLRNLNENLAAIIARSAAGGVDPTSGSAAVMQQYAMAEGIREKNIAADNALLAEGQAATQAHQYRMAGRAAQQAAFFQAAGTLGMGIYRYGQLA